MDHTRVKRPSIAPATHANGALLGPAGLFPEAPSLTSPAKPGETVTLYGNGFGLVTPAIVDGMMLVRTQHHVVASAPAAQRPSR